MKHKLLPRSFFFTFDTEEEAQIYGNQLESLLKRGIVPQERLAKPERADDLYPKGRRFTPAASSRRMPTN